MSYDMHDMSMHDMPDMDMPMPMCSMNMLFTWDYNNTCVIFHWWHITSFVSFMVSFIAITLLTMNYEYLRYCVTKWETRNLSLLEGVAGSNSSSIRSFKLKKSVLYGVQIGYSFMLMLVFMTYNGWLMIAVVLGAIVGNHIWGYKSLSRGLECH